MARIKTFTNGGSLLPGDLNSIQDDYEYAFSTYRELLARRATSSAAQAAGTFVIGDGPGGGGTLSAVPLAEGTTGVFYFDPADFTANTRTNKFRVRAQVFVNAVAPATTWTVGLYPVATWGGTSGNDPSVATLGAVVTGSTVAFASPGASAPAQGNSGDFTAPAAGYYVLAVVNSGAAAAGSVVGVRAALQRRQV